VSSSLGATPLGASGALVPAGLIGRRPLDLPTNQSRTMVSRSPSDL
jgi:hypothetical protein